MSIDVERPKFFLSFLKRQLNKKFLLTRLNNETEWGIDIKFSVNEHASLAYLWKNLDDYQNPREI